MATISNKELAKIRRKVCKDTHPDFKKETINLALQAIEDWFNGVKAGGSAAINVATSPYSFNAAQKKKLFAYWLEHKFNEEK